MEILILNGPNLNQLGRRQPDLYGTRSFDDFLPELAERFPDLRLEYRQSNHEGYLIDHLHQTKANGVVINAGGFTHTSVALADAVACLACPIVEVHLTNLYAREQIRRRSLTAPHCLGVITGFGLEGYALALHALTTAQQAS